MNVALDLVDIEILRLMLRYPRAGIREYARRLEVTRATVQSRLDKMIEAGVVSGFAPQLSEEALGYPVVAFIKLQLQQGALDDVCDELTSIPQVLEGYSTTGDGDLLLKVAARDNSDLEGVIQHVIAVPGVVRARSEVALSWRIPPRQLPLVMHLRNSAMPSSRVKLPEKEAASEPQGQLSLL